MDMDKEYLRRSEAAAYLQARCGAYTVETLARMASEGGGPVLRRLGRFPVYTVADLDAWLASKLTAPGTSTADLDQQRAA
jgi:hypothetical protein